MARLDGRVAVVTGASRGLGKAVALAFAAEGADVAVVARTERQWHDRLPGTIGETVAQIESNGGRAVAIRADLLDRDDRARLVEEARAALGPVTLLVNNAAFTAPGRPPREGVGEEMAGSRSAGRQSQMPNQPPGPTPKKADWPTFVGTPLGAYERHFVIGPFAAYELMQRVVPDMDAAGYGSIVNVTSGASRLPGEGPWQQRGERLLPGYGGSKAALEHLTRCAAYELADHNIAVNALEPSKAIVTPGLNFYSREFEDVGTEADFAEAAVRLATVDPQIVTGRVVAHLDVLDGSVRMT